MEIFERVRMPTLLCDGISLILRKRFETIEPLPVLKSA